MKFDFSLIENYVKPRSSSELARILQTDRRNISYWRKHGLTLERFEKFCDLLRVVPYEMDWRYVEEFDRRERERHLKRKREWARKQYRTNPDFRKRKLESSKAYYEECGDYRRAYLRRYHHERRDEMNAARRARYAKNADRERANRRARYQAARAS